MSKQTQNNSNGAKFYLKKAFAVALLLSAADCSFAEGKYGGQVLDSTGQHQWANNYRYGGILMTGVKDAIFWAFSSYAKDINKLGNHYGEPRP